MPRMTIQKILLIACIAAFAAKPISIGHAEKTRTTDLAAGTATYRTTSQMCPSARPTEIRMPIYKRYLNLTPAPRGQTVPARGR